MKRILITGKNSYIGNKFAEWVAHYSEDYHITKVSLRTDDWKAQDWSQFDVILHVAGIAHNSSDSKLEDLYFQVNRDLTKDVAVKAKSEGVSHFLYMSSIIVYGTKNEYIDENTQPNPDNFYGESKLQGEQALEELASDSFKVAIIRPPMVYGKGSKGNYPKLAKLARITPIFPDYPNQRSMIYIDNLTELIHLIIHNEQSGLYHPQNKEYVNVSDMVETIASVHNKKIIKMQLFNPVIEKIKEINLIDKVFGNLVYSKDLSDNNPSGYQLHDFKR